MKINEIEESKNKNKATTTKKDKQNNNNNVDCKNQVISHDSKNESNKICAIVSNINYLLRTTLIVIDIKTQFTS
jgi:FtsZ-binding cell division protein ZapB